MIADKQNENKEFQQQISNYGKTREIYKQYKASGWDVDFYEQFRADIMRHKAANQKSKDLCAAKSNASRILGINKSRETSRGHGIEI